MFRFKKQIADLNAAVDNLIKRNQQKEEISEIARKLNQLERPYRDIWNRVIKTEWKVDSSKPLLTAGEFATLTIEQAKSRIYDLSKVKRK